MGRRQPAFRTELERVDEETWASCCGEIAYLAGDLVQTSVNVQSQLPKAACMRRDKGGLPLEEYIPRRR